MLVNRLCVLFFIACVLAEDVVGSEEDWPPEEGRGLRDYDNQDWKSMERATPTPETTEEEQIPRRRRIRKRKRRPPMVADQVSEESTLIRRPQIREPWEEVSEEMTQRSYNRRRLTPVFEETKIRDPFTALQEEEEKQQKKSEEGPTADLKTLLKQSGALSLSEVLQQKNLSLAELLRGNQQAISALISRGDETTTETATNKYRRLFSGQKKNNRGEGKAGLSSGEIIEAQRKRLALLHGPKETRLFSEVTRYDVVTEETTEKRIFVPSSKFYTSVDYKPTVLFKEATTTPSSTSPKVVLGSRQLPITSAKLKKAVSRSRPEVTIPPNALKIDINEILGFSLSDKRNSTDGPLKMSIDLEMMTTADTLQEENAIESKTDPTIQIVEEMKITTAISIGEKLRQVTAKEEIMEILNNPRDKEQLAKILRMRNMTVAELVEQRERGSSQRHLADIFHNKTREPEPQGEPFIGHINTVDFDNFGRKSKSRPMPVVPTPSTKPPEITTKPPYTITSFPTYKIETNKNFKPPPAFLPVWKQFYPPFFPEFQEVVKSTTTTTTEKLIYDLDELEDIENTLSEAANSRLNVLNTNVYEENDFISLPSGVKSAIFASLAILGLSLVVFLTILVFFKWTQKQKGRLNYAGSFLGSKIRSPILEPDRKRSFKNFMTETLGKKKSYYKTHLRNLSDNFWDTDSEKKSYMV